MCSSMRNYNDENNDSDDYYAVVDCRQRLAAIKMAGCATAVVSSFVCFFYCGSAVRGIGVEDWCGLKTA